MADRQPQNRPKIVPGIQYFQGGLTTDFKMGIPNSFYASENLDTRTFPSQASVLPASRAVATNLQDCILAIQQDLSGVRWAVGDKGFIYQIEQGTNGETTTVNTVGQISEDGSAGLLYSSITDQLYIPGQSKVSLYGRVSSTISDPVFNDGIWGASASVGLGCTALYNYTSGYFDGQASVNTFGYRNNIVTGNLGISQGINLNNYTTVVTNSFTDTYILPNVIIEDQTPTSFNNGCFFSPDIEPFYSVAVYVDNVGTGNWTLTMHDSLNNNLGDVTIDNTNMVKGWNNFVFSSPIRAYVSASNVGYSATYHFHLTSSVTGDTATVYTADSGDLNNCNMLVFADRLVTTNNKWHPTAYFTGTGSPLLCIGNGNYLATYNFGNDANPSNSQFQRHNLVFRPGEEVCGMSSNYGYLIIGTEIRSTDATKNPQFGRLYFWDGSTSGPAFYIDLPMGPPYGLTSFNNVTYFETAGSLYAWSGGQTVIKVRKLAYQNTDYMDAEDQTRVNPNGFTNRYNILIMGYPSFTTDPNLDYGLWSWGGVEMEYPNSYVYSYSQSIVQYDQTTNTKTNQNYTSSNNLKLGCAVNFVDALYSSWQYTDSNGVVHSGLDVSDNFSDPAQYATFTSLIFDGGVVYKEKMAVRYKISCEPLPSGWTLIPWWSVDRTARQYGASVTKGATSAFVEWNNMRFHELQYGCVLINNGATEPAVILGFAPEIDPLTQEVDLEPNELPGQD